MYKQIRKDELLNLLNGALAHDDVLEIEIQRGVIMDETSAGWVKTRPSKGLTVSLKINGGAVNMHTTINGTEIDGE